jgi:hypothetical protein
MGRRSRGRRGGDHHTEPDGQQDTRKTPHWATPVRFIAVVGRSDISERAVQAMGLSAVHAIADHTDGDPAADPALSARLLEELGRTIPLPAAVAGTPADPVGS